MIFENVVTSRLRFDLIIAQPLSKSNRDTPSTDMHRHGGAIKNNSNHDGQRATAAFWINCRGAAAVSYYL